MLMVSCSLHLSKSGNLHVCASVLALVPIRDSTDRWRTNGMDGDGTQSFKEELPVFGPIGTSACALPEHCKQHHRIAS